MRVCRVIGNLVASCKVPDHEGFKIMAVRAVDMEGGMKGDTILALDCAQVMAGVKNLTPKGDRPAVNTVIIGVIDYIEVRGELKRLDRLSVKGR